MKRIVCLVAILAALCAGSAGAGDQNRYGFTAEQYIESQAALAQAKEAGPPSGAFVVIPQYFHSRNSKAGSLRVGDQKLKIGKSTANGAGVTAIFNKRVSDWFSVAFLYEYGFMKISGGSAYPADTPPITGAKEKQRFHSHVVGILPEFTLREFGKLQLSLIQGFDRPSGTETMYFNGVPQGRSNDDYGTNVTSLMAWYEKDFNLNPCWKLTPYAGWRSLYVVVKDGIDWERAANAKQDDQNLWVHLASAGAKLSYQAGRFGANVRGGISVRTSGDDIPGYGNRSPAPGVVHFSHRANMDKTVGSVGAGISYAISPRAILAVGYDGIFGSKTSAHLGSATLILPF